MPVVFRFRRPWHAGLRRVDNFLDHLFAGLKPLEGRFIPRGWSAGVVAGSVLLFAGLLLVLVFLLS